MQVVNVLSGDAFVRDEECLDDVARWRAARGDVHLERARWSRAARTFGRALDDAMQLGSVDAGEVRFCAGYGLGLARLGEGDLDLARRLMAEAVAEWGLSRGQHMGAQRPAQSVLAGWMRNPASCDPRAREWLAPLADALGRGCRDYHPGQPLLPIARHLLMLLEHHAVPLSALHLAGRAALARCAQHRLEPPVIRARAHLALEAARALHGAFDRVTLEHALFWIAQAPYAERAAAAGRLAADLAAHVATGDERLLLVREAEARHAALLQ